MRNTLLSSNTLWIVALSVGIIDAGLWFLGPGIEWYLGASGVLHARADRHRHSRLAPGAGAAWLTFAFLAPSTC